MRLPISIHLLDCPRLARWLHALIERSVAAAAVEGGSAVAWCAAAAGWILLKTTLWLRQSPVHRS